MKSKKDKWGRSKKFIPKMVSCKYRFCKRGKNKTKKRFLQKTYNHEFCADDHRIAENSLLSSSIKKKKAKSFKKKCSKCKSGKVPPGRRFLCDNCFRNADSSYFEETCTVYAIY